MDYRQLPTKRERIPQHRVLVPNRKVPYSSIQDQNGKSLETPFRNTGHRIVDVEGIPKHTNEIQHHRTESSFSRNANPTNQGFADNGNVRRGLEDLEEVRNYAEKLFNETSNVHIDLPSSSVGDENGGGTKASGDESTLEGAKSSSNKNLKDEISDMELPTFRNESNHGSGAPLIYPRWNPFARGDFEPIRIRALLVGDWEKHAAETNRITRDSPEGTTPSGHSPNTLTADERHYVLTRILDPAISAWSSALRVIRVNGTLTLDAGQLFDGISCGPGLDSGHPSVVVPKEHTTTGIFGADLVLYVTTSFRQASQNSENITDESEEDYQDETGEKEEPNQPDFDSEDGGELYPEIAWSSEDLPIYEAENDTQEVEDSTSQHSHGHKTRRTQQLNTSYCDSVSYLASATHCSTDQFDRPVWGLLHFCIDDTFFHPSTLKRNIITAMHEIGHVLGFNSHSMAHFREWDGKPLTPRNPDGNVPDTIVECTGATGRRSKSLIPLPSRNILNFRDNVRGGLRVAEIITPSVRQVVRNHFDCQNLTGAELESSTFVFESTLGDSSDPQNQGSVIDDGGVSCIGDHWQRRLFRADLMNPVVDDVPFSLRISPLTLAYFADSGWYKVNLSRSTFGTEWGRAAGCGFVDRTCVTPDGGVAESNAQFFCNDVLLSMEGEAIQEIHGCTSDLERKAVCSIVEYNSPLPPEFQYFANVEGLGRAFGGIHPDLEYCPVFTGFANGLCKNSESASGTWVDSMEDFGLNNSRCIESSVEKSKEALCLQIACVISDSSLRVRFDGRWEVCEYRGQVIESSWHKGDYFVCPDPARTCPTFYCPRNCLGIPSGVCNYTTGECVCPANISQNGELGICEGFDIDHPTPIDMLENLTEVESTLSEYYVMNGTRLFDESRSVADYVDRLLTQLSAGEVIFLSFATTCAMVALSLCVVYTLFFKWYRKRAQISHIGARSLHRHRRRRLVNGDRSRVRWSPQFSSHPPPNQEGFASNAGSLEAETGNGGAGFRRSQSSGKDKLVASLLVDLRIRDPRTLQRFRRQRVRRIMRERVECWNELQRQDCSTEDDTADIKCKNHQERTVDGLLVVRRSQLPPLPDGGRVVTVVGVHFVDDVADADLESVADSSGGDTLSNTTATGRSTHPTTAGSFATSSSCCSDDLPDLGEVDTSECGSAIINDEEQPHIGARRRTTTRIPDESC